MARLPPRLRPPPPARDGGGEMRGKKNAWTAGDTPRLAPSPDGSLRLFAAPFRRRPTADPVALRSAVLCAVCTPSSHGCGGCRRDGTSHAPAAANSVGSPAPPPPHLALGSSPRTQPTDTTTLAQTVSANLIAKEDIVSLERGCVCCSLRSDLVEALKELERRSAASGQPFDAVLLETTGVADPGPVVRWGA